MSLIVHDPIRDALRQMKRDGFIKGWCPPRVEFRKCECGKRHEVGLWIATTDLGTVQGDAAFMNDWIRDVWAFA